jgi:hypothetical protein
MSLLVYCLGFAWGMVLLACFAGWGIVVGRWLGEVERPEWGLAIARGIASLVALGGVLNGMGLISAGLIISLVGIGLAILAAHVLGSSSCRGSECADDQKRPRFPPVDGLSTAVMAIVLASYLNCLCYDGGPGSSAYSLNMTDDYQGYLVYPIRMLQTGRIGDDPFNDRRTSCALGGESFLQTFVLAVLPVEFIHVIDPGVASMAIAILLYSMAPRRVAGALTLLYLALPTDASNASAIALPVLLLLAIGRESSRSREGEMLWRTAARIGLPLAAVLTLKGTLIPGSVLIVAAGAVALAGQTRTIRPLAVGLLAGAMALLLLLPWMIEQYPSSGTLLYPFLGEGYRSTSTYAMPHKRMSRPWDVMVFEALWFLRTPRFLCGAVVGTVAALMLDLGRARPERRSAFLGILVGSLGMIGLFAIVFNRDQFYRYIYQYPTLLLLSGFGVVLGGGASAGGGSRPELSIVPRGWHRVARALAWVALAFLILLGGPRAVANTRGWVDSTRRWLAGARVVDKGEAESYRRLQEAVPSSAPVLACLGKPYLLDFRRNPVFVHDMSGAVSPPPGLPLPGSSESVARYLRGLGLRYVAAALPLDPDIRPREWLRDVDFWLYSLDVNSAIWTRHLHALDRAYESAYRDDRLVVIDLDQPLDSLRSKSRITSHAN